MYVRLWLLFFLAYMPVAAVSPLLSIHLQELGFSPVLIGWICATQAMGAIIASLAVGQVADRWLAADRCLAGCALLSAGLLWVLSLQTQPLSVFGVTLVLWVVMTPLMTLANGISFTHLPGKHFGWVRLGGTFGWMVMGWLVGYWFTQPGWLDGVRGLLHREGHSAWADGFRLGSLLSLVVAGYALTLPRTPPRPGRSAALFAPAAALKLLQRRQFAVYFVATVGLCLTLPFTTQGNPLLLRELGVERADIAPLLTLAQSTELVALGFLPFVLQRLGQRTTMLVGATSLLLALGAFALGGPLALIVPSLTLHGLFICFYIVAGQVFVNGQASGDLRVSAQGLVSLASGLGLLGGNILVGVVREYAGVSLAGSYAVAAGLAAVQLLLFVVGFSEQHPMPATQLPPAPLPALPRPTVEPVVISTLRG